MTKILPKGYEPFKTLVICSNTMTNGSIPIVIEGHIPFLVGAGEIPKLWVELPVSKTEWESFVVNNERVTVKKLGLRTALVSIIESVEEKKSAMEFMGTEIITAVKVDDKTAEIIKLDLRPFGLAIYGDRNGLNIGNQLMTNNHMSGVHTMVNIGA